MNQPDGRRRRFLQVLAAGVAGAASGSLAACLESRSGTMRAGNLADLSVQTLRALDGEGVAIGRDANGVYALSLVCTHEGCDMSLEGSVSYAGIVCNCHGAKFTRDGTEQSGPTRGPLVHYQVTIDAAGEMTIDFDTTVDSTTRVGSAAI